MLASPLESSLRAVYGQLMVAAEMTAQADDEDWYALVDRISKPGRVHEISGDAFRWFLHAWPPRLLGEDIVTRGDARRKLFHDAGHYERFTRGLEDEVLSGYANWYAKRN